MNIHMCQAAQFSTEEKMKKIVSLVLCLFCILAVIPACSSSDDEEDVGATVPVYFSTEVANFDPAYANFDDATLKVYGLIYEGLFKYDSKGKPGMAAQLRAIAAGL